MRVTQKDIAKKLNLSQSLVTGVLNNRPGVWASEETRRRVHQAAQELNYQPNAAARALRRGKSNVVACVFFGPVGHDGIVEKLSVCLADIGYDLLVKVILHPEQVAPQIEDLLSTGKSDATILWGLEHEVEAAALMLERRKAPFIVKGRFEETHPEWMQADFDHEGMMRESVRRLAARGRRCIAYFGYDNGLLYARKLLAGYRCALQEELGQQVREEFVCELRTGDEAAVASAFARWSKLPADEQPSAAAIGTGLGAWIDIERSLAAHGRRIGYGPNDFALIGTAGNNAPLLFGEGEAFPDVELAVLAEAMEQRFLTSLLAGEPPPSRIVRLLPQLRPLKSLRLPLCETSSTKK